MPPRTPSTDGYFTHWVYTLAVQKKKSVSLVDNLVAITQSTAANATPIVWSAAVSVHIEALCWQMSRASYR